MVADLERSGEEEYQRGKDVSEALLRRDAEHDPGESRTDKKMIYGHFQHSEHGEYDHDVADAGSSGRTTAPAAAIDCSVTIWPRPAAMRRVRDNADAAVDHADPGDGFGWSAELWTFPNSEPPTSAAEAMTPARIPNVQLCFREPVDLADRLVATTSPP